jgi:hypothetical protein
MKSEDLRIWAWFTLPVWVLGFFSAPKFIEGALVGLMLVPVWSLGSAVVFSWLDKK